jgi:hypothetical protein
MAKQKFFFVCSVMSMMRKLSEKGEYELLLAFLEQLDTEQRQQLVPNIQRYMHRVLAYDLYELMSGKK